MRHPTRGSMDMKVFGSEPETYTGIDTLNWFTYFADRQDYKEWFNKYLKKNKLNKVYTRVPQNIAVISYFVMKNKNVDDRYVNKLIEFTNSLEECTQQDVKKAATMSIQDRMDKQVALFGGVLDGVIDNREYKKFDIAKWAGDIRTPQARKLLKSVKYKINDIELDDEFTKDGYSYMSKKELKEYKEFLNNVKDVLFSKTVTTQKIRTKKPKSASKKVSKLKYMKVDAKSGITSQSPENIIDAKGLLLYNTKTRTIHYFTSDYGFDVKGTTLINFNEDDSFKQKVRKPDEFLSNKTFSKSKLNKIIKDISTKKSNTTGRINADMLILGIYK